MGIFFFKARRDGIIVRRGIFHSLTTLLAVWQVLSARLPAGRSRFSWPDLFTVSMGPDVITGHHTSLLHTCVAGTLASLLPSLKTLSSLQEVLVKGPSLRPFRWASSWVPRS